MEDKVQSVQLPLPDLTPENEAFWRGGAEGVLYIQRCVSCRKYVHPPSPMCPHCRVAGRLVPTAMSGRGTVSTFTINEQPWYKDDPVPAIYAIVELDEQSGLWLMTRIRKCKPPDVHIGKRVSCSFEKSGDTFLPVFVPEVA